MKHEILKERVKYFSGKQVEELTTEEIEEYLAIRKYIQSLYGDLVRNIQKHTKSAIKEYKEMIGLK